MFQLTWQEALYLYATLRVLVLILYGLLRGYGIGEGVI